jgi:4-amino-4-deoxy-L-arabinose transferase-like glycosyltransferase
MNNRVIFIIFVLIAAVFLVILGRLDLWDPDEPRYAEAAREMIESGDYLTPHFNYKVRFDKPPLFYWLIVIAYRFFGVSEFSARLFTPLLAVFGAILMFILGRILVDKKTGILSAVILVSCLQYFILGHACTTDMTFSVFITAALFFFAIGYIKEKSSLFLGTYICAALAVLTKGPAALALIGLTIGLFILARRNFRLILKMRLFSGALLFALIALPWYISMINVHGQEYINAFFLEHHIARFSSDLFHHQQPFYYLIIALLVGFLPWTLLLGQSLYQLLRGKAAVLKEGRGIWFFIILWGLVPVIFFSLSKAKLPTYILPAYPAFSLIVGRYLSQHVKKTVPLVIAILAVLLLVKVAVFELVLGRIQQERSTKPISLKAASIARPDDILASAWFFRPGLVFYTHEKIDRISEESELEDLAASGRRLLLFMKPAEYKRLKDKFGLQLVYEGERYLLVTDQP